MVFGRYQDNVWEFGADPPIGRTCKNSQFLYFAETGIWSRDTVLRVRILKLFLKWCEKGLRILFKRLGPTPHLEGSWQEFSNLAGKKIKFIRL